ncbi:MAG: hypoxanthine-guanine phosphoribosyltransferase [Rhodocyclaceae bacterium]|nr:hypoxanthine-guanine phosphoribosyltransferase [Rhodocyclaceae bacterium]
MPPDLDTIARVMRDADCLADHATVQAALDRMADAISTALHDTNPLIYTVMNGGLILAGQLLPRLPFPLEVAYLHATRYGDALHGTQLDWRIRPTQPAQDRTVLVLDDILDEGHTLAAIVERLQADGARRVHTAVLIHKLHHRKARPDMRADFSGLDIADRFLFGYGMDYKGYWRNAPGIYALKDH